MFRNQSDAARGRTHALPAAQVEPAAIRLLIVPEPGRVPQELLEDLAGRPIGLEDGADVAVRIEDSPEYQSRDPAARMNLQIRMGMRRFTRLTNAHSKKIENHRHALALYFMYYNFARIHQTLRVTPAMQAGVSDHVWSLEEIT